MILINMNGIINVLEKTYMGLAAETLAAMVETTKTQRYLVQAFTYVLLV